MGFFGGIIIFLGLIFSFASLDFPCSVFWRIVSPSLKFSIKEKTVLLFGVLDY